MRKILKLAAVLTMVAGGSALADTTFTVASGPKCQDESKPEFGLWTCPGPAGYAVRFADGRGGGRRAMSGKIGAPARGYGAIAKPV
jgi:hypothetical protein